MITDRSKAVLLLWIFFVVVCLSLPSVMSVSCYFKRSGHMLGKGLLLGSLVCDISCAFVTLQYCVLGHVWYLIV